MEPSPEEATDGSILVKVLAAVLERLVNSNKSTAISDPGQLTKFHALKAPGIGVEAYLERIHNYASCSNECFILALIYVDRLIERNNFLLTELNVHRVIITAILLAAKFFDDAYYNNAYYAKVGGVLVTELNGLEVDFLFRINFSLHVQPEVFEKYKAELVAHSINSGLIPAQITTSVSTSEQLPHIPEIDTGLGSGHLLSIGISSSGNNQQQQPTTHVTSKDATSNDLMMDVSAHVTPSPPNSVEDLSHISNTGMMVGHSMQMSSSKAALQVPIQKATSEFSALSGNPNCPQVEPAHHIPTFHDKLMTQEMEQSLLLQRANSLPRFSSERRCVNHAFKLPYSAPTMPATAPIMAVDQVQYLMDLNQLFPLESTLVHHNHQGVGTTSATIQDHHKNTTAGLVGHHPVLQGPIAYQVSWSGQIR